MKNKDQDSKVDSTNADVAQPQAQKLDEPHGTPPPHPQAETAAEANAEVPPAHTPQFVVSRRRLNPPTATGFVNPPAVDLLPSDFSDVTRMIATAISPTGQVDEAAAWVYMNQTLDDAGVGHDPSERVLVMQLAVAHIISLKLHGAVRASRIPFFRAHCLRTACKMTDGFRELALALKKYRAPAKGSSLPKLA